MPMNVNLYRILIASPSDVTEERKSLRDIIYNWNTRHSLKRKIVLEPVLWETHSFPEMGNRPQEILNNQLVKNCDILIGIFWTRLGTDTGEAESGTVEEINEFRKANKPVLLYFSQCPIQPNIIDRDQFNKLLAFRKKCEREGLIYTYNYIEDFNYKVNIHVSKAVDSINEVEKYKDVRPSGIVTYEPVKNIQKIVAKYYKVPLEKMNRRDRSKSIALARQVAMYLSRFLIKASLPEIGKNFGGRDHTTVLHAINSIEILKRSDKNLETVINELIKEFKGNLEGSRKNITRSIVKTRLMLGGRKNS